MQRSNVRWFYIAHKLETANAPLPNRLIYQRTFRRLCLFTKRPIAGIINKTVFLFMRLMESVGKYLKAERESQKLSLQEVSEATKIRELLLRAIEEDRYELISSPVYVNGFLDAYARYLGLDPNEIRKMNRKNREDKLTRGGN